MSTSPQDPLMLLEWLDRLAPHDALLLEAKLRKPYRAMSHASSDHCKMPEQFSYVQQACRSLEVSLRQTGLWISRSLSAASTALKTQHPLPPVQAGRVNHLPT